MRGTLQSRRTGVAATAQPVASATEAQAVKACRRAATPELAQGQRCGAVEYSNNCALLARSGEFATIVGKGKRCKLIVMRSD
jgi:hypothetical protein